MVIYLSIPLLPLPSTSFAFHLVPVLRPDSFKAFGSGKQRSVTETKRKRSRDEKEGIRDKAKEKEVKENKG
jgi:hypothetical protein